MPQFEKTKWKKWPKRKIYLKSKFFSQKAYCKKWRDFLYK